MLKVKNGKKEIFCDSILHENGSLKVFGIYNKTYRKEADGLYTPKFVQTGVDKLIINPVDVEISEFNIEEYTLKCLMDYVVNTITSLRSRNNMLTDHLSVHKTFLNNHSGRWYSVFIKSRITREQELVESYSKTIAKNETSKDRFESLLNVTNSKDLIDLLKAEFV